MDAHAGTLPRQIGPFKMYIWSVVIGVVGAIGAVVFRGLIALVHNVSFLGQWSVYYDANEHTPPSPWGPWIILVPVVGATGVAWLVSQFAPEAKGHGVPEVMDAIYYNKGIVRPVVALIKSLASALSIGSGGSVGREGPIVQIGSSCGSTLGQLLGLPTWQRVTLIAAGAGAGIAATFNTPIGGVLFALEIMLHEVSARTLVPVTIATVTSSYVGRLAFGDNPSFKIPALQAAGTHATDIFVLLLYPALGVLMGLVSVVYIRSIYACEDFFAKHIRVGYYLQHMLGMFGVGITMYVLLLTTGHYHVEGVGYATVQDVLEGEISWLLLILCVLKLWVTSLTLGSGASGGVFSPALYLGATLGGVYGAVLQMLFPGLPIHPAAFAVAGMAGVVGGSTGAALAAVVMIYEMTRDYTVIIPMTITVALSYGIRTMLNPHSIYTEKLARRGHDIPAALQANAYHLRKTRDVMDPRFAVVPAAGSIDDFLRIASESPDVTCFVVAGPDGIVGLLTRDAARHWKTPAVSSSASENRDGTPPTEKPSTLADLADRTFVTVGQDLPLVDVITLLHASGASIALVTDGAPNTAAGIRGSITKQEIAGAVMDGIDLFAP